MLGTFKCSRVVHQGLKAAGLSQQCTCFDGLTKLTSEFALIDSCVYDMCTLFTSWQDKSSSQHGSILIHNIESQLQVQQVKGRLQMKWRELLRSAVVRATCHCRVCLLDLVAIMLRTRKLFEIRDAGDCNLAPISGSIWLSKWIDMRDLSGGW